MTSQWLYVIINVETEEVLAFVPSAEQLRAELLRVAEEAGASECEHIRVYTLTGLTVEPNVVQFAIRDNPVPESDER